MSNGWWDLVPAVVGAVVGAAAAAIPAYYLARKTSRETLERDRISRRETQNVNTLRGLIKLSRIVNGLETLHRGIESMILAADSSSHASLMLWQKVMPMVGFSNEEVHFLADEIVIFAKHDTEYLNELLLIAERYATLQAAYIIYGTRRAQLTDQLEAVMTGQIGTTVLSPQQRSRYEPRFVELENLVQQLRQNSTSDYAKALSLGERYGRKARNYLEDPTFPVLALDEARAQRPLSS